MFHQLGAEIPKSGKYSLVGHKKIVEEKFFTRAFFRHLWRYAWFFARYHFSLYLSHFPNKVWALKYNSSFSQKNMKMDKKNNRAQRQILHIFQK